MLVFATVLGISRTHTWVNLAVLSWLIYHCHSTARWEPATFLSGVLIAELSLIRASRLKISEPEAFDEKLPPRQGLSQYFGIASQIFWTFLFLFGVHMGSHPQDGAASTPGYRTLMFWIPTQYAGNREIFWLAIGACLVVLALGNAPYLQRIFTTRIAQYLGEISFSLYVLHAQILFTMGPWLVPKCMNLTGGWANGQLGYTAAMLLALMALFPVTFWVSDLFSRFVDEKSVRFARWLSFKCFVKTE